MHDTAYICGASFAHYYGKPKYKVLDIGGQDVNGNLRKEFEDRQMKYTSVDISEGKNVDIVINPNENLPFEDGTFDLVISTSCFEHDPCFWITFREMCRIVKKDGYIYVNAPSNGMYHTYPGDNWRFYSDAGQALSFWASKILDGKCYPVNVVETFHALPLNDIWIDFVCVWKRVEERTEKITTDSTLRDVVGVIETNVNFNNIRTRKTM